jgi:phage shock protein PspC (stress-responsive transcriptional regulator)|tara:strand:- start:146 stop:322 length:177 start_codon:yes stop_codon:yes gene_type:complete
MFEKMNFKRTNVNAYAGGICGGLGLMTGTKPIMWRLIFVLTPNSLIIYLMLWLFTERI